MLDYLKTKWFHIRKNNHQYIKRFTKSQIRRRTYWSHTETKLLKKKKKYDTKQRFLLYSTGRKSARILSFRATMLISMSRLMPHGARTIVISLAEDLHERAGLLKLKGFYSNWTCYHSLSRFWLAASLATIESGAA